MRRRLQRSATAALCAAALGSAEAQAGFFVAPRAQLAAQGVSLNAAAVHCLPDEACLAVVELYSTAGGNGEGADVFAIRTGDKGETWTISKLGEGYRPALSCAEGLCAAVWEEDGADWRVLKVSRSLDSGATWEGAQELSFPTLGDLGRAQISCRPVTGPEQTVGDCLLLASGGTDEAVFSLRLPAGNVDPAETVKLLVTKGANNLDRRSISLSCRDGSQACVAVIEAADVEGGVTQLHTKVLVASTPDGGVTWTSPEQVKHSDEHKAARDLVDGGIMQSAKVKTACTETGVCVIATTSFVVNGQGTRVGNAWIETAVSEDAGVSWTAFQQITDPSLSNSRDVALACDESSRCVALWENKEDGSLAPWFSVASAASATTWSSGRELLVDADKFEPEPENPVGSIRVTCSRKGGCVTAWSAFALSAAPGDRTVVFAEMLQELPPGPVIVPGPEAPSGSPSSPPPSGSPPGDGVIIGDGDGDGDDNNNQEMLLLTGLSVAGGIGLLALGAVVVSSRRSSSVAVLMRHNSFVDGTAKQFRRSEVSSGGSTNLSELSPGSFTTAGSFGPGTAPETVEPEPRVAPAWPLSLASIRSSRSSVLFRMLPARFTMRSEASRFSNAVDV